MTVYSLFENQVKSNPDSVAVSFNGKNITYKKLMDESDKLAYLLQTAGVNIGDIVGLCLNRSIEMVIALLGILKSGAAYLPLDPFFPDKRLEYMLKDSDAKFLITESSLFPKFNYYKNNFIDISEIKNVKVDKPIKDKSDEYNLAYVIYTSGSTGNPKGVQILHSALTNFLLSMQKTPGLNSDDNVLALTTLSFDISGLEIFLPLITGARITVAAREEAKDGKTLLEKIRKQKVSVVQATPSTWKMLIDSGWNDKLNIKALCGGEALSRDLAEQILNRVNELWNMYGPTETTIWSSCSKVIKGEPIHLGRPIANTQFYIVDKDLNFCPPGVPGELLIGGAGLSVGYLNKEELTNEKFIPNPFDKENKTKVYRTGDLVKLNPAMQLEFLGRIDNQVKIRGYRIELDEIESVIKQSELVKDCATVVKVINNDKRLVAYVVPKDNLLSKADFNKKVIEKWKDEWDILYDEAKDKSGNENKSELDRNVTSLLTNDQKLVSDAYNEWFEQTIKRIKELKPKRVMEIGSGGGQILKAIAQKCEYFVATDISEIAIIEFQNYLQENIDKFPPHKLYTLPADSRIPEDYHSFDTIIINTVIQYFPDVDYLLKVIENALDYLADGGRIYIGDVQCYSLLNNYHLNDQLLHIKPEETVKEFKALVRKRIANEPEFVIDPVFFYSLPKKFNQISNVIVKLRDGKSINETTLYHYDVFLIKQKKFFTNFILSERMYDKDLLTKLNELENDILKGHSHLIKIKNIPNRRLSKSLLTEKYIETAPDDSYVKDLLSGLNFTSIDETSFEEILQNSLSDKIKKEMILSPETDLTHFDLILFDERYDLYSINLYPEIPLSTGLNHSFNSPKSRFINELLISEIKHFTGNHLPDYMIPSLIIPIEELPLTPNNKIDKKSLTEKEITATISHTSNSKPENETQKTLLDIWESLLGITGIGIDDNFFEIGGHSILAAQMLVDFEKQTGKRIPLAEMFTAQTIRQLAGIVEKETIHLKWSPLVEIKKGDASLTPLFLIHGAEGNVLLYKDLVNRLNSNRPVYGLQAKGLDGKNSFNYTIEEMAEDYIRAIKSVQPSGPYNLGGYCMGGSVVYEIALRLTARGERVANVFLLETYNACTLDQNQLSKTRIKDKIENIKFHFDNVKSLSGKEKITFIKKKAETAMKRTGARINKFASDLGLSNISETASYLTLTVRDINDKAQMEYSPSKYRGKVVLLRPKVSFATEPDAKFGWGDFIEGEFKVYNLDVAPRGMLTEPFVKHTAQIIESELTN